MKNYKNIKRNENKILNINNSLNVNNTVSLNMEEKDVLNLILNQKIKKKKKVKI